MPDERVIPWFTLRRTIRVISLGCEADAYDFPIYIRLAQDNPKMIIEGRVKSHPRIEQESRPLFDRKSLHLAKPREITNDVVDFLRLLTNCLQNVRDFDRDAASLGILPLRQFVAFLD